VKGIKFPFLAGLKYLLTPYAKFARFGKIGSL
jgi:hypothetical protein